MESKTKEETPEETHLLLDFSQPLKRVLGRAPNGEPFEVRTIDELSAEDEHLFKSERARYGELEEKRKLNGVERTEYAKILQALFERIVVASEDTRASFNDKQRQKVIVLFTASQLRDLADLTQMAGATIQPPTTES